ncbi:putative Ribonuclease P protein subunit [Seiridium cardinale]|uniref:Ribonuclease P protein subunit n=1 Tax=Seiridium cardinale TaxID=138064 RepID=A0ABR2Y9X3_9PEZI
MASTTPSVTNELLARAHSPDNAQRIFSEKIQYRPLFLRPNSPPPSENARQARRKAREDKKKRARALKPSPLTSRERRKLGLYDLPKGGQKYDIFGPLNRLWTGYISEVLGNELYTGGQGAAAKLAGADYHGAEVEVCRSRNPSRVGLKGIVIKDTRFTFEIITRKNQVKTVPKEGTTFRITVPVRKENSPDAGSDERNNFIFDVLGDQFQFRPSDRANKKFRSHYLKLQ